AGIVADGFDPITDAKHKTYRYRIDNGEVPDVFARRYAWHIHSKLDVAAMEEAAAFFVGTFDFKAFAAAGGSAKTSVRTIFGLRVERNMDMISIDVTGNGFLYNMVRIIVGTLAEVGLGKRQPADIPAVIASLDRKKAGQTAPAMGLTMVEVVYPAMP
ncbi:MAG: tRNA pseudouridine(38-40) synthase TruA, partial [Defluviitaleaceae bacterium]|nr:tRNA pseudouridine(38-40) synthase TruA [Defluviitaleaceae bacterium]